MTLELRNVSRSYGGYEVVRDVDLKVATDSITGLIGPNGAGKTTLFSLINGLQRPSTGSICLNGQNLTHLPAYKRAHAGLGWTFQVPRPFSHLTVRENLLVAARDQPGDSLLMAFLRRRHVRVAERLADDRASDILGFLRLAHVQDQFSKNLSGGQKKLMELGRALMLEPRFILLDEPFAGVNPVLIQELGDRIAELKGRGIGFLIIEHDLGSLTRLADRMVVLDRGKVIADGDPQSVLADEEVRIAYLGDSA